MKISIVASGKIKEKYLRDGINEFVKRLKPFTQLEFIEINEEKMKDNPSPAEKKATLIAEGERLLKKVPANSYLIVLDVLVKIFPQKNYLPIDKLTLSGQSHITFLIGGAFGLSEEVRKRADERISFSRMTFTHQMIRLLLVEQIYRAFKISRGEKYHW